MKNSFLVVFALLLLCARVNSQPKVGPCDIFPANNPWNVDVSDTVKYPTNKLSDTYIAHLNANRGGRRYLHPDFGHDSTYGIPYEVVSGSQPFVTITYNAYGDQSDPGPYPIPPDALVEGGANSGGDQHVLVVDTGNCVLYELYSSTKNPDNSWTAASGAVFDLSANHYRPDTWTSADAAGLPIYPGLVRYDEVQSGEIKHAVRFTTDTTSRAWIFPARHHAGSRNDTTWPPMGLRLRLKAGFDLSPYKGQVLVILKALKKYGMILADNGSGWFISGSTDTRWNDDTLSALKNVLGSAFEVVDMGYRIETDNDTITLPGDSLPVTQTPVREVQTSSQNISLSQNAPNPFGEMTNVEYRIPNNEKITLNVYNALGRQVAELVNGFMGGGEHMAVFNAAGLPGGVYIVRLQADGAVVQRMMQVLR